MSDASIRLAQPADIPAVLALWRTAEGPTSVTDTHDALAALLEADHEALLLAEVGAELCGSLICAWDGWRGSFYKLAVHPRLRRRGVAGMLVREGERRLRARGARRLTAIVAHEDAGAVAFWSAAGYERQEDRARFVRDG